MQTTTRARALTALTIAGVLWGTSVPLSKVALGGVPPLWLTVLRFAVAGLILLAVFRPRLRSVRPALVVAGALGYGAIVAVQNIGLGLTSVTHAALIIGSLPVLVAVLAVAVHGARVGGVAWLGFALSLAGVAVVAGAGGGTASLLGDGLVLLTVLIGAVFTLVQARLLPGQDVVAVSAAQFLASAAVVTPVALSFEGAPSVAGLTSVSPAVLAATAALATVGTVLPYTLFALGQTGVAPQVAGVFLNLETLVAAALGIAMFAEPVTVLQLGGAVALLVGIALSTEREPAPVAPAVDTGGVVVPLTPAGGLDRPDAVDVVAARAA